MKKNALSTIAPVAIALLVAGCQPAEPAPDIVKTQRDALNKARAVEGQLQQQAQERQQAGDAAAE